MVLGFLLAPFMYGGVSGFVRVADARNSYQTPPSLLIERLFCELDTLYYECVILDRIQCEVCYGKLHLLTCPTVTEEATFPFFLTPKVGCKQRV